MAAGGMSTKLCILPVDVRVESRNPSYRGLLWGFWEQAFVPVEAECTAPPTMPAIVPDWPLWAPTGYSFFLRTSPENTVAKLRRSNIPFFWTVFFLFFFSPLAALSSWPPRFTVLTIVSNRCAARARRLWSSCLQTHGYAPTILLESWGPEHTPEVRRASPGSWLGEGQRQEKLLTPRAKLSPRECASCPQSWEDGSGSTGNQELGPIISPLAETARSLLNIYLLLLLSY